MEPVPRDQRLLVLFFIALLIVFVHGLQIKKKQSQPDASPDSSGDRHVWFDIDGYSAIYAIPESGISFQKLYNHFNLSSPADSLDVIFQPARHSIYRLTTGKKPKLKQNDYRVAPLFYLPIPINQSDAKMLTTLPGIGEKIAGKIVNFRDDNGNFKSIEELTKVDGVGEKKLEILKEHVIVDI